METYRIVEVTTRKDLRRFVEFPDRLYRDCPQYVPALHADQIGLYLAVLYPQDVAGLPGK